MCECMVEEMGRGKGKVQHKGVEECVARKCEETEHVNHKKKRVKSRMQKSVENVTAKMTKTHPVSIAVSCTPAGKKSKNANTAVNPPARATPAGCSRAIRLKA